MPASEQRSAPNETSRLAVRLGGPPVHLTPFLGRARELAEVRHLLESRRLLTLTGAGGSGKTRIASELAAHLTPELEGIAWVDLGPVADSALVARATAAALGLREEPTRPDLERLLEAVTCRRVLLVLDNCEHVLEGAAAVADALLRSCPQMRILATSRQALGVAGETAWLVPPLSLPQRETARSAEIAAGSEAVQLFVDRAQAALPTFRLTDQNAPAVAQICLRLDGIPLAIELAAARVRMLSPQQIAERLDDAFRILTGGPRTALPRQKTLRETLDWSYALLSVPEQILLARLSVFAGGFSLEAAEVVCSIEPLGEGEVLDTLAGLVDKSLVVLETRPADARYRMLETVRQYARERLTGSGELDTLRQRHADFFIAAAEEAEPHIFGGEDRGGWIGRLEDDYENLAAAADYCTEDAARSEAQLRFLAALHWSWFARGRLREATRRLDAALRAPGTVAPNIRARALTASANVAFWTGNLDQIRAPAEEAVLLLRKHEDEPRWLVYALSVAGLAAAVSGDAEAAAAPLEEAVRTARQLGRDVLLSFVLYWRGLAAQGRGDNALARDSFDAAAAIGREFGSGPATAHPLTVRGRLAVAEGDLVSAWSRLGEALTLHAVANDRWGGALTLEGLAALAAARSDHDRAVRLLAAAAGLREAIGATPPRESDENEAIIDRARVALGPLAFQAAWDAGLHASFEDATTYALWTSQPDAPEPPEQGISLDGDQQPTDAAVGGAGTLAGEDAVTHPREPVGTGAAGATSGTRDAGPAAAPDPRTAAGQTAASTPAAALRVLALGPLQIYRDGVLLSADAWGSAKPRELLLFLLSSPSGATREQVGLALWPDASAAQVRNSFHVTMHRLRKALGGSDWIVLAGDRYRLDPKLVIEFDVDRFERDVEAGLRELRTDGTEVKRLECALALYRGEFLDGEWVGDWHLERRDRLQRLYRDALAALGDRHFDAGAFDEAASFYRRLILADDLHEEAYRRLMVCLVRQGDRSQALRLYLRLAELLRRELDAEPEAETIALFEQLQQGQPA